MGTEPGANGTRPRLCSVRTPPAPYRRRVEPPGHLGPYRCPSRDRGPRGAHAAFGGRGTRLRRRPWALIGPGLGVGRPGPCLRVRRPRRRQAAVAVMAEIGQRLASLLATLHAPGTAAEQGWSPWRQDYLRHWATWSERSVSPGGWWPAPWASRWSMRPTAPCVGLGAPVSTRLVPRPGVGSHARRGPVRRRG